MVSKNHLAKPRQRRSPRLSLAALAFAAAGFCAAGSAVAAEPEGAAFSFDSLQARAQALASAPYKDQEVHTPESLLRLTYDEYSQISFDGAHALWAHEKQPFRAEFDPPGFIQTQPVRINEVEAGRARPIPFSPKLFNYGKLAGSIDTSTFPADMSFTGFRLLYPLNKEYTLDEVVEFQGSSYFRALSKGARYGLSARGLAINTGDAGGEEFPAFEEFWLEHPEPGAISMRLWALLDSPSVTGAYQFVIFPSSDTLIEVTAVIYRRAGVPDKKIKALGIAPLTSMFWFGQNSKGHPDDLHPSVHDSDGFALHTSAGEWLWRPLTNPRSVQTMTFSGENPQGFGLFQRDRRYETYEDIEDAYHLRPSAWVEPLGNWGKGAVHLVEFPTTDENSDNMDAFWTPDVLPSANEPIRVSYRIHWFINPKDCPIATPPMGYVAATRQGHSSTEDDGLRRFWVDFAGDTLEKMSDDARVDPVVNVGKGATLAYANVEKNPYNNTWRAAFAIKPDDTGTPVELRCSLKNGKGEVITETWSYLWNP